MSWCIDCKWTQSRRLSATDRRDVCAQLTPDTHYLPPRPRGGRDNACLCCFLPIFFIISFHFARLHTSALAIVCLRFFIIRYFFLSALHFQRLRGAAYTCDINARAVRVINDIKRILIHIHRSLRRITIELI